MITQMLKRILDEESDSMVIESRTLDSTRLSTHVVANFIDFKNLNGATFKISFRQTVSMKLFNHPIDDFL